MTHDDTFQPTETGRWSQNATTRKHRTGEASETEARPNPRSTPSPANNDVPIDSDASPRPDRQTTRLRGYDYSRPGLYFITICTHRRKCLFGDIENGRMRLTTCGRIVVERWRALPRHFPHVTLDAFVVMPNHAHGIVVIKPSRQTCTDDSDCRGEASETAEAFAPDLSDPSNGCVVPDGSDASPLRKIAQTDPPPQNDVKQPTGTTPGSLGAVVQNFKSTATRKINRYRSTPGQRVWQRGYYDRIIRDEREWHAVRNYIRQNSKRWEDDRNNPPGDG